MHSTIETVKEFVNLLKICSCWQVFTAAASWKNIKNEISGVPYMMGFVRLESNTL
jgi:hypothetical protein